MPAAFRQLLLFAITSALVAPIARADDDFGGGHFFSSFGYAGLLLENGVRDARDGMGISLYGEGMMLGLVSHLGHRSGLEGSVEAGWAGFTDENDEAYFGKRGPMHFELAIGFPIALVQFGDGGPGSIRLQVAPGFGFNVLHAYGYLRGRFTVALPASLALDVSYKWMPMRASYAWEENTGLNAAQLRFALHANVSDLSLLAFLEISQANLERFAENPAAGPLYERGDPLLPVERSSYQNLVRLGAGWVF